MKPATRKSPAGAAAQKNRPLVEDIRLLGRLLGEVIQEQEGRPAFELIERVRKLSVGYRLKQNASAGATLDRLLKGLSNDQTVSVIRAFSYFSHLANIAEDRQHVRRREYHERRGDVQEGSLAFAFGRLARRGVAPAQIADVLARAYISPVLTAHPTEVQRKSILDAERAIAELVQARELALTEPERSANDALLRARITQLWQTRMLRTARLTVADEIENVLSYYPATFLGQIPRLYAEVEQALPGLDVASFFRMGIGSAATATATPLSPPTPCAPRWTAKRNRAAPLSRAGARTRRRAVDLSALCPVTPELQALAERSGDHNPHRLDEPYRRALIGVYARLAATLQQLTGTLALRHAVAAQDPYSGAQHFLADLRTIDASLASHHAQALPACA